MIKVYVVKIGSIVNRPEIIKHSLESIPDNIRRDILRAKPNKEYEIPSHVLSRPVSGHCAHALKEILFACGENGNKEVDYRSDKGIKIYPKALDTLKDVLRD